MNAEAAEKINAIIAGDCRYKADAYDFVLDALANASLEHSGPRHLSAVELLESMRNFARKSFGEFDGEIFHEWGVNSASDFGNIVYNLIAAELLFANENDRRSDFDIDFELTLPPSDDFTDSGNTEIPTIE